MSEYREASLEELTHYLDRLVREYSAADNQQRRSEIATKLSEVTTRILAVRCRPPPDSL
jgi:hypothetical protein